MTYEQDWELFPVTHGYITDYQGTNTDTPHYAYDIATPQDTPFWFPTSGTIEQADYATWSGQSGGGEVFIKPDSGGDEMYAYHLDQILVQPGQHVNAGTIVGLTGGQNSGGSHPTSPMWSSGPHVHVGFFEDWQNTPDGTRPYGPDPQPIVDAARTLSAFEGGSVSASYQVNHNGGVINAITNTTNGALDNVPVVGGINQLANTITSMSNFLSNGGMLRIGIFAVGALVIVGGIIMLSHTGSK